MIQIEEVVKTSKKPNIFSVSFFKQKKLKLCEEMNLWIKFFWQNVQMVFTQKYHWEIYCFPFTWGWMYYTWHIIFLWVNEIVFVKTNGNIESCKQMIFSWVRKNTTKEKIPKKNAGETKCRALHCVVWCSTKNPGSIQNNTGNLGQQVGGIKGSPAAFLFLNKVRGNQLGTETSSNS